MQSAFMADITIASNGSVVRMSHLRRPLVGGLMVKGGGVGCHVSTAESLKT